MSDTNIGELLAVGTESASLERLYRLQRALHVEYEQLLNATATRAYELEAAKRELDKAQALEGKTRARIDDVELAILDRRRAERGGGVSS